MRSFLRRIRKQDAVYWPPIGVNEHAEKVYGEPEPIKVRWVDQTTVEMDENSIEQVYTSSVLVGEEVKLDGMLWKGKLKDLPGPAPPSDARRVRKFAQAPDLRAKANIRVAML